jgi:hypothetical protein
VQLQASFKHCEDPAQLANFLIALFLLNDPHFTVGTMTGNDDFRIPPGRVRRMRAAKAKSFLARALKSAPKVCGFPGGRARNGRRFGRVAPRALL